MVCLTVALTRCFPDCKALCFEMCQLSDQIWMVDEVLPGSTHALCPTTNMSNHLRTGWPSVALGMVTCCAKLYRLEADYFGVLS
jgi:hypothetical protein